MITIEQIDAAKRLPNVIKKKIAQYETQVWAVDLMDDDKLSQLWAGIIENLDMCVAKKTLTEKELTLMSAYLTTTDTMTIIDALGKLTPQMMERFIASMQWYQRQDVAPELKEAAQQFKERIMVTYRLVMFPVIFSEDRISTAITAIKNKRA